MKKIIIFLIFVLLLPLVQAQISIESFSSSPSKVLPGGKLRLSITLENIGENDTSNIIVKLDLSQVPFAPLGSSNEEGISKIKEDDQYVVNFDLIALPNAESQIYKVPVEISFGDIKKTSLISLEVSPKINLDLILDNSDLIKVNDLGKVNLKFVNNGLSQIKSLKVSLQNSPAYEILSTSSVYIGEIDIDDFETEEFTIIPKVNNPQLVFDLTYRDVNNNEFKETKLLGLNVYTEEQAQQLGLVSQSFNWFFVVLLFVVLILVYFYRRAKKRNAA